MGPYWSTRKTLKWRKLTCQVLKWFRSRVPNLGRKQGTGNSGDILYQSVSEQTDAPRDGDKIRFLPLLLIKDLIKANFQDRVQYVRAGGKTAVFWEKHSVFYVACTNDRIVPVSYLLHQLRGIHRYLRFNYGFYWQRRIANSSLLRTGRRTAASTSISLTDISQTLSQLPFISDATQAQPLYAAFLSCHVEQVELNDDLHSWLVTTLRECCEAAFPCVSHHTRTPGTIRFSSLRMPPRQPLHDSTVTKAFCHEFQSWSSSYLFAREKIVVKCQNTDETRYAAHDRLPADALYFIKLLASQYIDQVGQDTCGDTSKLSGDSSSDKLLPLSRFHSLEPSSSNEYTPPTISDSPPTFHATSSDSASQKSSLPYIYNASSPTAPFKIQQKSSSSVTLASSSSSTPSVSWSSPPPLSHKQLFPHLSRRNHDQPMRPEPNERRSRHSMLVKSSVQHQQLPRNAKVFYLTQRNPSQASIANYLSSSVPLESDPFTQHAKGIFQSSAPSSPQSRSRSHSILAEKAKTKDTLKSMFYSILTNEPNRQRHASADGKVVWRWIKVNQQAVLCRILLVPISGGLCAVVVCQEQVEKTIEDAEFLVKEAPPQREMTEFRTTLQDRLRHVAGFLLTKEMTHFSILSFATRYPGLVYFMHYHDGIVASPRLVDLNEMDENHELLLDIGEHYELWADTPSHHGQWTWPSVRTLEELSQDMLNTLPSWYDTDVPKRQVIHAPANGNGDYQYMYQHSHDGGSLCAVYFNFVPRDILLDMHQRLFNDIRVRIL